MSSLFNKKEADDEVIKNLLCHIKFLEGELKMSKIVKTVDGEYYRVDAEDQVSPDEVANLVAKCQQELQELQAIAPGSDQGQPTLPEQPPADPATPPADPAPAADPNPAPEAPPADPNAPAADPAAQPPANNPDGSLNLQ